MTNAAGQETRPLQRDRRTNFKPNTTKGPRSLLQRCDGPSLEVKIDRVLTESVANPSALIRRDLTSRSAKHLPWTPPARRNKRQSLENAPSLIGSHRDVRSTRRVSGSASAHLAHPRADRYDPVVARRELPGRQRLGPSRIVSLARRSPD